LDIKDRQAYCKTCNKFVDRDTNAAKNIFIRAFGKYVPMLRRDLKGMTTLDSLESNYIPSPLTSVRGR
jgi:transposase